MSGEQLLPYPSDEAATAKAAIDELIDLVGSWITRRSGWAETYLPSWTGPNQVSWSEDFGYSQGDAAVMIDDLQALRHSVESTMNAIANENAARQAAMHEPYSWFFDLPSGPADTPVGPSEPLVLSDRFPRPDPPIPSELLGPSSDR
jgi:hypothetical protein